MWAHAQTQLREARVCLCLIYLQGFVDSCPIVWSAFPLTQLANLRTLVALNHFLPIFQMSFFFFFSLFFLGPHLLHKEVSRLGDRSELQPAAYAAATGKQDTSHVCNLHHSSRQYQILNPMSKARDGTCILMDPSQVRFLRATTGTSRCVFLLMYLNKNF